VDPTIFETRLKFKRRLNFFKFILCKLLYFWNLIMLNCGLFLKITCGFLLTVTHLVNFQNLGYKISHLRLNCSELKTTLLGGIFKYIRGFDFLLSRISVPRTFFKHTKLVIHIILCRVSHETWQLIDNKKVVFNLHLTQFFGDI